MKSLIFALFLYVSLVWVGAIYLYSGPKIQEFGLLWTIIGLIALLAIIAGARLWGWWRLWRAKSVGRPAVATKPAPIIHEDDAALAALVAEANANLAKAPAYASRDGKALLSGLPIYLLVGPEGSGKTSTFLNSGLEPVLLAGQVAGTAPLVSTRLCNIWLARNAIFIEMSGRVFSGDLDRWTKLLGVLRGNASVPLWRRLWGEPRQGLALHGVIGFCDVKEFTNASNFQRLERYSRDWQERLRAIGDVFSADFPVYQVVTKCDAISFFSDYFRRLQEPEASQVLGCTLPLGEMEGSAEAEVKRITRSFSPLYQALAKRRLEHLAHEPDPVRRPGIYEFPRELKRIRSPLAQFLGDVFRPHPLRRGPQLRGYYLTATRQVEVSGPDPATRTDWSAANLGTDASRLFRGDATRIFNANDFTEPKAGARSPLTTRWIFTSDLFHRVILADRPARQTVPVDARLELYRRTAFGVVCGVCAALCLAFFWSWMGNRELLREVHASSASIPNDGKSGILAELQSLDALRSQVQRLRAYDHDGAPWRLRWGLYSGGKVFSAAREAYFRRFQKLLLNDLNGAMVARLAAAPVAPGPNDPYDRIYGLLKTHLMISSGSCKTEPVVVSGVLKEIRGDLPSLTGSDAQAIEDRQIDFYAAELAYGNPCRLTEDAAAEDRARQYLRRIRGVDRIYSGILAKAEKALAKPQRLSDLAPNYAQVLNGAGEVSAVFSRDGWSFVEKASKEASSGSLGETCVIGRPESYIGELKQDAKTAQEIQRLFVHDYVDRWRKFVAGFSVAKYSGPEDAARKLDILADHKSPLLALFAMTANRTSFESPAQEPGVIEKVKDRATKLIKKAEKVADKFGDTGASPPDILSTPADINRSFQPVHWVVPPASEMWVGEKNRAYIDSLLQLRHSMQDIARGGNNPDPAVHQAASQNYDKALDAVRQIASGFKPLGVEGLDVEVKRLLEEPILRTNNYIIRDMDKNAAGKINGELRQLCVGLKTVLRNYPFQKEGQDLSLGELSRFFAPSSGEIWKFQAKSLAELIVKEGSHWKAKDATKKPLVTLDIVNFLDKGQAITDAFYPGGVAQPHFTYTLRPKDNSGDSILELQVDGQTHEWTTSFQHQFTWPAPPGMEGGGRGRIKGKAMVIPFASRGGLWGIFKMMGDAEPRGLNDKLVIWKNLRGGDGRLEPIEPPVRVDIVEFPAGVDLFNPKFFQGYQCPAIAVQ